MSAMNETDDSADGINFPQWARYCAFAGILWLLAVAGGIGLIWAMLK